MQLMLQCRPCVEPQQAPGLGGLLGEEGPFAGESDTRRESWEIHNLSGKYHLIFRMMLAEEASAAKLFEGPMPRDQTSLAKPQSQYPPVLWVRPSLGHHFPMTA